MIILDETYVEVSFFKEKELGIIRWKQKSTSDEYKKALNTLLTLQANETITRYISDIRKQGIISLADRKWFEQEILPKSIGQGLKVAAVVFDGNAFKKYYMNVFLFTTNKFGLPIRLFNNIDEATFWVMNIR